MFLGWVMTNIFVGLCFTVFRFYCKGSLVMHKWMMWNAFFLDASMIHLLSQCFPAQCNRGRVLWKCSDPPSPFFHDPFLKRIFFGCGGGWYCRSVENQEAIRMAVVNFPSRASASHAFITKNRGFCLNNQIAIRILH